MFKRMNTNVKKMWVDTLRSGDVTQGFGVLATVNDNTLNMCCLGVLCAIHNAAVSPDKNLWEEAGFLVGGRHCYLYMEARGSLPLKVSKWAGIDFSVAAHLVDLNDTYQNSFSEIADWLDQNL